MKTKDWQIPSNGALAKISYAAGEFRAIIKTSDGAKYLGKSDSAARLALENAVKQWTAKTSLQSS